MRRLRKVSEIRTSAGPLLGLRIASSLGKPVVHRGSNRGTGTAAGVKGESDAQNQTGYEKISSTLDRNRNRAGWPLCPAWNGISGRDGCGLSL